MSDELTSEQISWRDAWLADAERVFRWAGLDASYERIPNEYCGPAGCDICAAHPWLLVTTVFGVFKFGWRKRVMVLDWSGTIITAPAEDLFRDQDTTKYGRLIHCWGYAMALDYLRRLVAAGNRPGLWSMSKST